MVREDYKMEIKPVAETQPSAKTNKDPLRVNENTKAKKKYNGSKFSDYLIKALEVSQNEEDNVVEVPPKKTVKLEPPRFQY